MTLRNRAFACAGASALGLLTAITFAVPAVAEDAADLAIEAAAGTIAARASGKFAKFNINNNSHVDAKGILVTLDISGLDQSKVHFNLDAATGENGPVCGQPENGKIYCGSKNHALPAGIQFGWFFPLEQVAGAAGDAGRITATITHDGADPDPSNNSVGLTVRVGGVGPDMFAVADDVEKIVDVDKGRLNFKGPLRPGEVGTVLYMIVNQGDTATTGMRIMITLPEGTTFVDAVDGCVYAEDNRSAVCTYDDLPLIPASQDTSTTDNLFSKHGFYSRVRVDADVVAPAILAGGSVSVEPLVASDPQEAMTASAEDVDVSDNTDGFAVLVF